MFPLRPPFIEDVQYVPVFSFDVPIVCRVFSCLFHIPSIIKCAVVETRALVEGGPSRTSLCSCHFRKWSRPNPPSNARRSALGNTRPGQWCWYGWCWQQLWINSCKQWWRRWGGHGPCHGQWLWCWCWCWCSWWWWWWWWWWWRRWRWRWRWMWMWT